MLEKVEALAIPDVKRLTPTRYIDDRGYFSEVYNAKRFKAAGITADFIQDNVSYSKHTGTVRGLHFQAPPFAQSKLVRVVSGAIVDVAVDVRRRSPTFGQWVRAEISAETGEQIFIPQGFLHGFATLQPHTEVQYKVDVPYSKEHDGSVRWNDPNLAIDWGIAEATATLSDKDAAAQLFADFVSPF